MLKPSLNSCPSEKVEPKLRAFENFLSLENQPYRGWGGMKISQNCQYVQMQNPQMQNPALEHDLRADI